MARCGACERKVCASASMRPQLGLGAPPTTPSWGILIAEGRGYIREAAWLTAIPGAAIAVTVLGLNLLGDGLRDVLDPRLRVDAR